MFELVLPAGTLVFRATRLLSWVCSSGGREGEETEEGGNGEREAEKEVEIKEED